MIDDEAVREALLELQFLREREAATLAETQSLLACLEAYTTADTARTALRVLFRSIKAQTGASLLVLLERVAGPHKGRILAASLSGVENASLTAPVDLFTRTRNMLDMHAAGDWQAPFETSELGAALVIPARAAKTDVVLLAFKPAPEVFSKIDQRLVDRLVGLVARAQDAIDVEAQNTLLSASIEGSSSGFAISDARAPNHPLVYVNKAFETITGFAPTDVLGRNCRFMIAEPKDAPERARLRETVARNGAGSFLLRNKKKNGQVFWNELSIFPVMGEDGAATHLVATQNDVTPRIAAREDRERMRQQMEQALTATENAFLILDPDQRVVLANDAMHDLFFATTTNWAKGSTFAENWQSYLDAAADFPGRITHLLKTPDLMALAGLPSGREVNLPDGRIILIRAALLPDGGLTMSATNVTQLKTAQTLLSQRLAAIEAAGDGIGISDDAGRLVYANPACAQMLGYTRNTQALGQYWYDTYDPVNRRQRPQAAELTQHLVSADRVATHEITQTPLPDGGYVIVFRDVTQVLDIEKREQEMQVTLQRLQREHATSQLASGIAHDFNNLLSAINGSATLIGLDADLPAQLRPHLDRILQAGQQSATLINQLLDVGDVSRTQGAFSLQSSLEDVQSLVWPSLPETITLHAALPRENLVLAGESGAFSQAIMNIVLNARDAIGAGPGDIYLQARRVHGGATGFDELQAGQGYVRIDIRDTGPGMDETVQAAIFAPYYTTKGRKGTGLGLAMVDMQMRAIKGKVVVDSTPGAGANFSVYWPLAAGAARRTDTPVNETRDLSGMTIIVVDDDVLVGSVIGEYLEAFGAEVAVCTDPQDALDAVTEDPGAWSAVVTDYDMPRMNGGALIRALHAVRPDLPIVLVTALARRLNDPRVTEGHVVDILAKPVNLERLAAVLASTQKTA